MLLSASNAFGLSGRVPVVARNGFLPLQVWQCSNEKFLVLTVRRVQIGKVVCANGSCQPTCITQAGLEIRFWAARDDPCCPAVDAWRLIIRNGPHIRARFLTVAFSATMVSHQVARQCW